MCQGGRLFGRIEPRVRKVPHGDMRRQAMGKDTVISVKDLKKVYLDFWRRPTREALKGISFSVERGSVFALLGPNGSGKSTTIKLLLGLISPSGGELSVFGEEPGAMPAKKRIGYLPELTELHRFLTPRETLGYYAGIFNLDAKTARERTAQLLEMVGLSNEGDREIGQFSKGMARRVGIAQALINNPDLLIWDEPTSGLDPVGASAVKKWIRELAAAGKTILLSSHILADIEDSASHVAILCDGEMKACGPIGKLLGDGADGRRATRLESFFLDTIEKEKSPPLAPFLREPEAGVQ